jgi:hypothetical protein
MHCRGYRRAVAAYEGGPITQKQTDLLNTVDTWRREEDGI